MAQNSTKKSGGGGKVMKKRKVWYETPKMRCEKHHIGRCKYCVGKQG